MNEETTKPARRSGLAGKSYAAIFRSDRTPERVEFEIGGNAAWVDLLPMDKDDRDAFVGISGGLFAGGALTSNSPDLAKTTSFLIGHTVVDYRLWTRTREKGTGALLGWQEVRPPEGADAIANRIREAFAALPEFWDDLLLECSRVNGFTEDSEGN